MDQVANASVDDCVFVNTTAAQGDVYLSGNAGALHVSPGTLLASGIVGATTHVRGRTTATDIYYNAQTLGADGLKNYGVPI